MRAVRLPVACLFTVFALVGVLGLTNPLSAQDNAYDALKEIAIIDELVMMPMRDGVRLATNIFRPKGSDSNPVGTIYVRTPYNMNPWRDGELNTGRYRAALDAVRRGYAYVNQNERGRYYSDGEWDILGPPKTDGYDALTWISNQRWSNGKVGTYGCSSSPGCTEFKIRNGRASTVIPSVTI